MSTREEQIALLVDAAGEGDVDAFTEVLITNLEVIDGEGGVYAGWTALMRASFHGHTAIVQVLLAHGAQVDIQNDIGKTALMKASYEGHTAIVQLLLDHGAQVDVHDSEGDTELMHASYRGHTAIVQILLDCGALVYIQNVSDRILTQ